MGFFDKPKERTVENYTSVSGSQSTIVPITEYPAYQQFVHALAGYISPILVTKYRILPSKYDFTYSLLNQILTDSQVTIYINKKTREIYSKKEGEYRSINKDTQQLIIQNNSCRLITTNQFFMNLSRIYTMLGSQDLGRVYYAHFNLDKDNYAAPNANEIKKLTEELSQKLKTALLNPTSQFVTTTQNLEVKPLGELGDFEKLSKAINIINAEIEKHIKLYYGYNLNLNPDDAQNNNSTILAMRMFYDSIYLPYIELTTNFLGQLLGEYSSITLKPKSFNELFHDERAVETKPKEIQESKDGKLPEDKQNG